MFGKWRAFIVRLWFRLSPRPVEDILDERLPNPTKAQAKRIKRRLEH
jgi:hypothetical protein